MENLKKQAEAMAFGKGHHMAQEIKPGTDKCDTQGTNNENSSYVAKETVSEEIIYAMGENIL